MLEKAGPLAAAGLRFELGDIGGFDARAEYDLVFSNAALHWVPDHHRLLRRLRDALRPGGQLAVQVPANGDHPSHALPFEIAHEPPFRAAMLDHGDPLVEATPVLAPESYAALLDELGFTEQSVRLQVYGHHLASTADVVEWTRGTTLTRYERALPPDLFAQFVDRYRARLLDALGEHAPFFYTFKRVLFWGKLSNRRSAAPTVIQVRQAGRAPTRKSRRSAAPTVTQVRQAGRAPTRKSRRSAAPTVTQVRQAGRAPTRRAGGAQPLP